MHDLISAAAPHAAQPGIPHAAVTAGLALLASAVIVVVLKVIGKIFTPKKASRPAASPYSATRR